MASRRWSGVLPVLCFVVLSAAIAARAAWNLNVAGQPHLPGDGLHDFRDVVYYPAVAVLDGRNPYDAATFLGAYPVARPFAPYAPTTLLLHLPLALLPYPVAQSVHFGVNVGLVLALAYVCLQACRLPATMAAVFGLGTLILLGRPAHMALYIGQCAVYLVLATYLALILADRRPFVAGLALAVACVKPTFGVPLAVLMLARRDRSAVAWGAFITAALGIPIVGVLIHAAGGPGPLIASIVDSYTRLMQDPSANPDSSLIRLDAIAFLDRFTSGTVGPAGNAVIGAGLLAAGAAAVRALMRAPGDSARLGSATVATLTILASTYHQTYDGLLLTLPLLALVSGRLRAGSLTVGAAANTMAVGAMLVPLVNYLATDTVASALALSGTTREVVAATNGVSVLVAFGALVAVTVRRRPAIDAATAEARA